MDNMFSDWLQKKIKDSGLSQSEFARRAGVSRQAISNYLNGQRSLPDNDILKSIAKALGISPEVVFRAAGLLPQNEDHLSSRAEQLIHLAKTADDESLDLAITMLEAALRQKEQRTLKTAKP